MLCIITQILRHSTSHRQTRTFAHLIRKKNLAHRALTHAPAPADSEEADLSLECLQRFLTEIMSEKTLSFNSASCSSCSSVFAQGCVAPTQRALSFHGHRLAKLANRHECFLDKVTYCIGVLSFGLFCYLLGSSPQVIPYLYCLFYISIVPLRWMYYRSKKWHYYLLDFCYFANGIFVSMLLFFPTNSRLFMLCFSFSEGPLAWALIVWRCSLVFSSIDKIISVLIHLLPGTVFFILRWWDENILFLADVTEDRPSHRWPVVNSIPTLWLWLFMAPLMVYCIWQGLYFLVVEGLRRQRILQDPEVMTSYKELKRKAERANNIWWLLSGLLGDENRVYMYAVIQGAFTIATLAFTVPIFKSYHLHICFEVFKLAAIVWNGGRYVFEVMPRQAAKKLSNNKDVQMAVEKLSFSSKDVSNVPSIGGGGAEGGREEIFNTDNTQGLDVCQLCRRVSRDNRGHVQSESREIKSNADAVQLLRLMLEKQNNQEKQSVRCDSLDQSGFEWNRHVACAS